GIDRSHHPRVKARGLDEAARNQPLGRLGGKRGTRRDHETHAARSVIFPPLIERAEGAEEPREDRLVQVRVAGWRVIGAQVELADAAGQLVMKILPFAHAQKGQEVLSAPSAQLIAGKCRSLLAEGTPEIEHGNEVGAAVREQGVLLVSLL